jgi:TPR repeat protein
MVGLANRLRLGIDLRQDLEQAAQLYSEAGREGNAEALYNLAVLTREGTGIARDVLGSIRLFEEAASMPQFYPNRPQCRNIGVVESQHALGLVYENGEGVDINWVESEAWYRKAVEQGSAPSANNLAKIYSVGGPGLRIDAKKALEYWTLAAYWGSVRAMDNMALIYLVNRLVNPARDWYNYGVAMGSSLLPRHRAEFEILIGPNWDPTIDKERFRAELLVNLQRTSLNQIATEVTGFSPGNDC